VAPRDSAALAGALLELLQSPETRMHYGDRGRVTARAHSWERVAARLLRFYDEVRAGASGSGEWSLARALQPAEGDDRIGSIALSDGSSLRARSPSVPMRQRAQGAARQGRGAARSGHPPDAAGFRNREQASRSLPRLSRRGTRQA
jgi:hypothetical protein